MGWASGAGKGGKRAASLSFGMPSTNGMMDAMVIRKTVTTRLTDITRCYEREMQLDPSTSRQTVSWRFSVAQDGRVLYANPATQSLSSTTSSCISTIFRGLTFPARPSGGSVLVTLPLNFDSISIPDRPMTPEVTDQKVAWTPFAVGAFAPARATTIARAAESVLRGKAAKIDACFAPKANGSLRTLLGVQSDGTIAVPRAGGLGDETVEQCVEKELAGVKVVNPSGSPAEIACDFSRGDAQPWRVTPSALYGLIEASKKDMTFGKKSIAVGALEPDALPGNKTYLIVADPETPGAILSNALAWASEGDASLVAMRDGKGSPVYLGMGKTGVDDALASRPMMMLDRKTVQACLGRQSREGKISEAGQLAMKLAKRCKSTRCGSLVVGMDDLALVRDLVEVTGAARRAGFERVLIGGRIICEKSTELEDIDP
jgi:hypothetical protein